MHPSNPRVTYRENIHIGGESYLLIRVEHGSDSVTELIAMEAVEAIERHVVETMLDTMGTVISAEWVDKIRERYGLGD